MKCEYSENLIELSDKKLSELDMFVKRFIKILQDHFDYVIISGYVAILFGRNRISEDIDVFIEKKDYNRFKKLWEDLSVEYECINTDNAEEAYYEYLKQNIAIRFSKINEFIPNFELKFPKSNVDVWTLSERKTVRVNNDFDLFISPLELEIPYKLFLGSEKDIEDARFLYQFFKDQLDQKTMVIFNQKLKTNELFERYLK
jgi:hypothetical protein